MRAKIAVAAVALGTLLVLVVVVRAATHTDWTVLQSGLDASKMPPKTAALDEAGIEYKLADSNTTLEVPADQAPDAMNALAEAGQLDRTAGDRHPEFEELFGTTSSWSETDSDRRAKQQELLEGKVANHIEGLAGIERADVTLNLPVERLFEEDSSEASAAISVVTSGEAVESNTGRAIRQLVAFAVPDLNTENIQIIDQNGAEIGSSSGGVYDAQTAKLEVERRYNQATQLELEAIAQEIVGPGNVQVLVNTSINLDQVTEEALDYGGEENIQGPLRIENTDTEELESEGGLPAGPAGTASNTGDQFAQAAAGEEATSNYDAEKANVVYDNDMVRTMATLAAGDVDRLNIAATFDDSVTDEQQAAVEAMFRTWANRTDEEAQTAFSFSSAEFAGRAEDSRKKVAAAERKETILLYGKFALIGLGLIGLAFFLRKTLMQRQRELMEPVNDVFLIDRGPEPIRLEELEAVVSLNAGVDQRKRQELQRKVADIAQQKPSDVAVLLRGWMHDEEHAR